MKLKLKQPHPLEWLLEPLETQPGYQRKKMFGCEAAYIDDRIVVVLAAKKEPWNGLLLPTEREHHGALQKIYPELQPHSVLGKWLYLSQSNSHFEEIATAVVQLIRKGNPLIGVERKAK
jgi:hypothetical protein